MAALAWGIVGSIAFVKLLFHIATSAYGPYEFHRDEFLYFAMGEHLRMFSMDFPPFIAMLAVAVRGILGDSIAAIRLPIALASTALVLLAAYSARILGGGRFAQGLAALCVFSSVLFLRSGNLFQPVALDQLWWTFALISLMLLGKTGDPKWWVAFGLATGFGLLTKFSILFLGLATAIALVSTHERRWLATRWPWIAAMLALVIGSPSIVGQVVLGFPVVGQMAELTSQQLQRVTYADFVGDQFIMYAGFPIAVVGVAWLTFGRSIADQRLVGVTCIASFLLLMLLQGKSYYIGPIFPVLFGAGAVVLEKLRSKLWGRLIRWGSVAVAAVYLVVLLPVGLPVLAPESMEEYLVALGMQEAATTNVGLQERIPQDYADMLNWNEMTAATAEVYHGLSDEERARAVIVPSNYGEAGAIEFYGPRNGLPPPVSFIGSFWYFGPGELPGDVIVLVGHDPEGWLELYDMVTMVDSVTHPFAVAEQRNVSLMVARGPRSTLQDMWPSLEGRH